MKKKLYRKPKLIILARPEIGGIILTACKRGWSENGPYSQHTKCDSGYGTRTCTHIGCSDQMAS